MNTDPSTPVLECIDLSKDERKDIAERTPPYDGVRTYADLCAVRAQFVPGKMVILPRDATVEDVAAARAKLKAE